MKLQEQLSRKVNGRKYPKYVMTVPPKYVDELGWEKGIDLTVSVEGDKLIITPKSEKKITK
jgi:antitoxin component of MazEF toxin-antitoxin module